MKILAIDTATEACSAALNRDGKIETIFEIAPRDHTRLILKMVEQLLQAGKLNISDLDALSFGRGPGSFTGVRIAAGIIQGLAFADQKPVVPVSNLAAIAQGVSDQYAHENILCAIDARMQEVYWAEYRILDGVAVLEGKESVISPDSLGKLTGNHWVAAGTGWKAYRKQIELSTGITPITCYDEYLPSAEAIARLAAVEYQNGRYCSAAEAMPVYLRDNVAKKAQSSAV